MRLGQRLLPLHSLLGDLWLCLWLESSVWNNTIEIPVQRAHRAHLLISKTDGKKCKLDLWFETGDWRLDLIGRLVTTLLVTVRLVTQLNLTCDLKTCD